MAVSRYNNRNTKFNEDDLYKDFFNKRGVEHIIHYTTPEFIENTSFSVSELKIEKYIWKQGDRLYKLSSKYYNDPTLWWVIAKFNMTPTENHLILGQTIYIPLNLEKAIRYIGF